MNRHSLRGLVAAVIVGSFALVFGGCDRAVAPLGPDLAAPRVDDKLIAAPRVDDKLITNAIGMKLTLIPAGSFQMGSDYPLPTVSQKTPEDHGVSTRERLRFREESTQSVGNGIPTETVGTSDE